MASTERKYPVGAEIVPRGTSFRVYASSCQTVEVALEQPSQPSQFFPLISENNGYFSAILEDFKENSLYRFRLNGSKELYPDPASRFQPSGPFGPSQIIDPRRFTWRDQQWKGIKISNQIIYELHIGTFTQEGTLEAALKELKNLVDLGITVVELMPLHDFPGEFGWGYDGVNLFAPTRLYGTPDHLRQFIDEAHDLGLGVILDVVYNHFGPEGNFITKFSDDYYRKEETEWGRAINFDKKEIREFFATNARYWIEEYHFDGLRLDATHAIICQTSPHIFKEISEAARLKDRDTIVIAEDESQQSNKIRSIEQGGYGFDAIWNDDFHHAACVRLTGRREAYYKDFLGSVQELISCLKHGFLYQGQYFDWYKRGRGTLSLFPDPHGYVIYIQNHDQISNSAKGDRIHLLTDSGNLKAMTGLMFMMPNIPMLFQGQEFGSSSPFLYFADHSDELNPLVDEGRKEFLSKFPHISALKARLPNSSNREVFLKCKLDFSEREKNGAIYRLHKDLIALKKKDPTFSQNRSICDGAVLNENALVIRYITEDKQDRLILVNFGKECELNPMSEPLLAPCEKTTWEILWNSESQDYEGQGMPPMGTDIWKLPAHCAVILAGHQR